MRAALYLLVVDSRGKFAFFLAHRVKISCVDYYMRAVSLELK